MWAGRHIVLGVTGGIAAYKTVQLARDLTRLGAMVDVVLSRGAEAFVGPVTFEAMTRRPVRTSLWTAGEALDHISLGRTPDLIIVAPATAHCLARCAAGLADDLLTALLLAATAPVLIAPAMNDRMYDHPATRENLARLERRGWHLVGPAIGDLAEGPSDQPGRMVEPHEILATAGRILQGAGPLTGLRVVVTAGATREALDPVRVITNRSSGKMGYRLAEAAWRRGAEVVLISGPSTEPPPFGVRTILIQSTREMAEAVQREVPTADLFIMAAAPADFRPVSVREAKLPRADGGFSLAFESTEDILQSTIPLRHAGMTVVGFALETGEAELRAAVKLQRKQLDLVVANDALTEGAGFEVDTNVVTILDARGGHRREPLQSKARIAEAILDAVEAYRVG